MDVAVAFNTVLAWIHARLAEVPPWLWTLLVGAFCTWLGYRLGAQGRISEAHHAAIKEDVLRPLRQRLDFLLTILEQRMSPVVRTSERLPEDAPRPRAVGSSPTRLREGLRAWVPQGEPVQWLLGAVAQPIDQFLYECMKGSHLPDLVRTFEDLVVRVGDYCGRCLRLAEEFQETFTARAPVPVLATVFSPHGDPPWLNPAGLAHYVLDYRLGVDRNTLVPGSSKGILRRAGGLDVCDGQGQLDACIALVEELLPDDGRAARLVTEACALASEAQDVRQAIEEALRMGRLEGRCQYLRSRGWRSWIPWC